MAGVRAPLLLCSPCPSCIPFHPLVIQHCWVVGRAGSNLKDMLVQHCLGDWGVAVCTAVTRHCKPELKVPSMVCGDADHNPRRLAGGVAYARCLRALCVRGHSVQCTVCSVSMCTVVLVGQWV